MGPSRPESKRVVSRGAKIIELRPPRSEPFPEPTDEELVQAVREGDAEAQERLFERYASYVERLLVRLLGHEMDAVDALQDVFLGVFTNLQRLRKPAALRGWIRAIVVATARKRIRSAQRRRWLRFLPPHEVPEQVANGPSDEVMAALQATYRVLDGMATELRLVFVLRYLEQFELEEVAEACGISLATTKRRLSQARRRFALLARREPALQEWMSGVEGWIAK